MEFVPSAPQASLVLCADCGTPIEPNSANLCLSCLRNSVDITEGIPKQATINYCRNCERYLNPPQQWVQAQLESRELLAICLKKLKGLHKARLIDAGFIWTEPHSKRLRVKLTVQKEVLTATVLQQIFEVEYIVQYGQCPDCTRLAAKNTWRAQVQVRQKVPHKRTFLYLEQLILKHNAHKDTVSISERRDGLDFYYVQRTHAVKMCEFLSSVVPVRITKSEQVIGMDTHTSTTNYKFTYSVEIAPICKDDLVCIPRPLAKSLGNIGQLLICTRVNNSLRLLDPTTLQTTDIPAEKYWRNPFPALATIPELVEFLTLDIEANYGNNGHGQDAHSSRWLEADAQVSPLHATSFGEADAVYHTRTHLGNLLQAGDQAMGYHLRVANFNSSDWDSLPSERMPDVVLVKKSYPDTKRRKNRRTWKLKTMAKEGGEAGDTKDIETPSASTAEKGKGGGGDGRGAIGRRGGLDSQRVERDYEYFLRELEEDEELRANVNIWRDREKEQERQRKKDEIKRMKAARAMDAMDESTDAEPASFATIKAKLGGAGEDDGINADGESEWGDDDVPAIPLDELLDDLEDMHMDDDNE
ncbi:NMD3-domain-containing protein [Tilletiaria anomala UBC 951]|uniref:60S ribosomal export protein NMD3 n=1 Tax=Tilletiaria anomala (strain ATCC 24038 / CBS 436.72 / UBC 951) TaxID=1037660 RepID=A0A066WPC5_TILAU|nr:NMD3-domain-containing protein [Tilletiaria anomala UBC 951]KDN52475.1 NMD3-domain-containing protein [Tilletiaria anomala UBC 951]